MYGIDHQTAFIITSEYSSCRLDSNTTVHFFLLDDKLTIEITKRYYTSENPAALRDIAVNPHQRLRFAGICFQSLHSVNLASVILPVDIAFYVGEYPELEEHIKSVLKDGDTMCIVSSIPFNSIIKTVPIGNSNLDWLVALGDANGAFCVIATREGDSYNINGTYYVSDTYDYEENDTKMILPGLVNDNMFKLHSAGIAQAYYVYGELEMYRNF